MKKNLLGRQLVILLLFPFFSYTQDLVIKGTKEITKQFTPKQVIDSLQKTFPNANTVKYYKGDVEATQKGWAITKEDELDSDASIDYYTISFKQEGLQYYGLYDQEGTLLEYKIQQKMDQLPDKVVTSLKSLAKDYPGYKVVAKDFYMMKNNSKSKEYYQVTAKKR